MSLQPQSTDAMDKVGLTMEVQRRIKDNRNYEKFSGVVIDSGICPNIQCIDEGKIQGLCFSEKPRPGATGSFIHGDVTDATGHGTAVASLLAGKFDENIQKLDHVKTGCARGSAPDLSIRVYKLENHSQQEMETALKVAIDEGVDLINVSLSVDPNDIEKQFSDPLSEKSFMANNVNIMTCFCVGNRGPGMKQNIMPWASTTAAATATVDIYTNLTYSAQQGTQYPESEKGCSINRFPMNCDHELLNAGNGNEWSKLDPTSISDKIVILSDFEDIKIAKSAAEYVHKHGGAGIIIITGGKQKDNCFPSIQCPLPAVSFTQASGQTILTFMDHVNRKVYARIHVTEQVRANKTYVAKFSARGHHPWSDHIPKPDFTAPGTLICCARCQEKDEGHCQRYKLATGTSYATPIVSGAMLALRVLHPTWTCSMIKSALMTTADELDMRDPSDAWEREAGGAGMINLEDAENAALLYNITPAEYSKYVLNIPTCGYRLRTVAQQTLATHLEKKVEELKREDYAMNLWDLNYPAFRVCLTYEEGATLPRRELKRRVTYAGKGPCTFGAVYKENEYFELKAVPEVLHFTGKEGDPIEKDYTLHVRPLGWKSNNGELHYAQLGWKSDNDEYPLAKSNVFLERKPKEREDELMEKKKRQEVAVTQKRKKPEHVARQRKRVRQH